MTTPPHADPEEGLPTEPIPESPLMNRTRAVLCIQDAIEELRGISERIEIIQLEVASKVAGCWITIKLSQQGLLSNTGPFGPGYIQTIETEVQLDARSLRSLDPPLESNPVAPSET